jgi:hypothetical protein
MVRNPINMGHKELRMPILQKKTHMQAMAGAINEQPKREASF